LPVARHVGEVLELKYAGEVEEGRSRTKSFSGQFDYGLSASTHAEEYCLDQTETARDAADIMDTSGRGMMLIRDSYRHCIVGRVSDRHFLHHIMAEELTEETPVEQIMYSGIVGLDLSCRVERAINLMFKHHVRHLPVFDLDQVPAPLRSALMNGSLTRGVPDDALAGVVDISDVVFAYAHKIRETPGREYCSTVTVQSMLDSKLRGRDPLEVYAINDSLTVWDVIQKMQGKHNIGSQVVLDAETGKPTGFVTERDVITKVVNKGLDPSKTQASDVMVGIIDVLRPTMSLDQALQFMEDETGDLGWKYYPVLDENDIFKGVLTLRDVIKQLHRDPNVLTKAKGEVCEDTGTYVGDDQEDDDDVLAHNNEESKPPKLVRQLTGIASKILGVLGR
jgi:CBS domain-containing protein